MSISRSRTTSGVIQPAQSFRRGNTSLSSTRTSAPPRIRRHAADEPAGPPPTTATSQVITAIQVRPCPGDIVVVARREQHLKQLHRAGGKRGEGAGEIEAPHAYESL